MPLGPGRREPAGDGRGRQLLVQTGLDSLCGVIDLLEGDPELRLGSVAHYDGGQAASKQPLLHARLAGHYGAARVQLRRLWGAPHSINPARAHPGLPVVETTTRSRSFLFLAAALALASSHGTAVPVYIPENGYIALNVPLSRARAGQRQHPYDPPLLPRSTAPRRAGGRVSRIRSSIPTDTPRKARCSGAPATRVS